MTSEERKWINASMQEHGYPGRSEVSTGNAQGAITIDRHYALPRPAFIRSAFINVRPKAFNVLLGNTWKWLTIFRGHLILLQNLLLRAVEGARNALAVRLIIASFALPLTAQISVALSPMPALATQRLFGKRVGKAITVWTVGVENVGTEPVSVAPSAVLRRVANLQPYDHATVALLIEEGNRNSGWARAGRSVEDGAKVGAFLAASKQIRWGPDALTGWTAFLVFAPYVLQRFQGAAVPSGANFERLAWVTPLQLGPGESGSTHLFSAVWSEPTTIEFVIETGKAAMRRSIQ